MDGNHRDKAESKLAATEDTKWVLNKKNTLWIPKHKKRTGFEDKTRWERLQLIIQAIGVIILPISIIIGVWQFTIQQQNDLTRSIDVQQQTTLQNYLGNMSDLLLKENLRGSKPKDVVRQVAEAQTLTALQNLNPARKGILVKFLYESHLIDYDPTNKSLQRPIIDLFSADLSGADLSKAALIRADLSGADLSGANLTNVFLIGTDLIGADLIGAWLGDVDLSHADLSYADLSYADLSGVNLTNVLLIGANLSHADLSGAILTHTSLLDARNLSQQQLDEVKSCQFVNLPQGLTCH